MAAHDLWNWAHSGHVSGLKECLDRGEDMEAKWLGQTPLYFACRGEELECVKLLLEYGANVNATVKNYWSPLHHVIVAILRQGPDSRDTNLLEIVKCLLSEGANIHQKNDEGKSPLGLVLEDGKSGDLAEILDAKQRAIQASMDTDPRFWNKESADALMKQLGIIADESEGTSKASSGDN